MGAYVLIEDAMKYKDIIREFEIFANVHPDVAKFKSDTVDRLDNFSNENEVFPMLYVSPISNVPIIYPSEYSATIFSFRAFVLVPRIDLEEIALDNDINLNQTNTNLEQCQLIINHFKTHLNKIIEELSFGAQPLNEFGIDRLQGWSLDFDIEVPTSDCEEDWIPTDFCPPGVAKNTSGSFSVVVQADSTEIIPDITVTDSDGTTRTQPSVTDVFCKLSEDSTITLNNAPFITVPSGATENIQLVKEDLTPFSDYTVVGNVVTVGDCTNIWEIQFIGTTDLIAVNVTLANQHTFTSETETDTGDVTYSTDGITFVQITFPFTPSVGLRYFKRPTALVTGTYILIA